MQWNVFRHNINTGKIESYNIFEHTNFKKAVERLLNCKKDKKEFEDDLRILFKQYYCSRSEYEVAIQASSGGTGKEQIVVDVYTQVLQNWDVFVTQLWNNEGVKCQKRKDIRR